MSVLSQATELGPAYLMMGLLLAIVIVAGGIMMWVRSRTLGERSERSGGGLFEDLGRMRDAGEISEEEYAAARRSVVDRMAGQSGLGEGARLSRVPGSKAKEPRGTEPGIGLGEPDPDGGNEERSDLRE